MTDDQAAPADPAQRQPGEPPKDDPSTSRTRSKPQPAPDPGFVAVGRILAPFGLKGEVKVQSLTDNTKRFAPRARLYAGEEPLTIAETREAGGYLYVRFKGHADRSSVERLRHRMLQVPERDLPSLEPGEYYRFQLIGLIAVDRGGSSLGTVAEVIETGANDVLRIAGPDSKDVLVPLLDDTLVSVDLQAGRIVLDPPDWR